MSRHCQDCIGDCCCPSLEAEIERLRIELRAAYAMVLTGVDKCARADALCDEWKAAYEGTDRAAEQREWQDERNAGIESDKRLRADLASVTAERDELLASCYHLVAEAQLREAERDEARREVAMSHDDWRAIANERDAARENEINALGLVDTRTNQLAEARAEVEAAFKDGYCHGIGFEGTSEMNAAWADYQRERKVKR